MIPPADMSELVADLDSLIRTWRRYIDTHPPRHGPFFDLHARYLAGITICADQLELRLERARLWRCMGCGDYYLGDPGTHDCPVTVKPLRGGIGLYGLDWTYA